MVYNNQETISFIYKKIIEINGSSIINDFHNMLSSGESGLGTREGAGTQIYYKRGAAAATTKFHFIVTFDP